MSWTDLDSVEQIKKIKNLYNIKTFVETGTFRGTNAQLYSNIFDSIFTCELVEDYFWNSKKNTFKNKNVFCFNEDSPVFLSRIKEMFKNELIFIYLDAHFYDPKLNPEDRWVVLKELKILKDFPNCVIAIHDFDNEEFGHLTYDGQPLNFDLLKNSLLDINPNFNCYTNTKTNIITMDLFRENYTWIELDDDIKETINFIWSRDFYGAHRGILYCTPTELDLSNFNLRKI